MKKIFYKFLRRVVSCLPCYTLRHNLYNIIQLQVNKLDYTHKELALFYDTLKKYPAIISPQKTLKLVLSKKLSFCRIGDGEFQSIVNAPMAFEPINPILGQRLQNICERKSMKNCLICLNNYKTTSRISSKYFLKHGLTILPQVLEKVNFGQAYYGDAYFLLRLLENKEKFHKNCNKIKLLWNGCRVLFVINNESLCIKDEKSMFDNVIERKFVFIPSYNAFDKYEQILNSIKQYSTDWIVYLEAGPTAKQLCMDLTECGYRVLDMGDFYKRMVSLYPKVKKRKILNYL